MIRVLSIVVDYNTTEMAARLCEQLGNVEVFDCIHHVVHVDNGNKNFVELSAQEKAASISLLRLPENDGYAGGINGAIKALDPSGTNYDIYWFLNSDIEVAEDALRILVDTLVSDEKRAAVGPQVFYGRSKKIWGTRGGLNTTYGLTSMAPETRRGALPKWSYIPGCALMVRSGIYHRFGGLPSRYRLYFEETEFCVSLQRQDLEIWVEPNAHVYHAVNSMENSIPSRHYAFYFIRNNLYFWSKNFGRSPFVQTPSVIYLAIKEIILPLRKCRSLSQLLDRLVYLSAGFIDGFFFLRRQHTPLENILFKSPK